MNVVVASAGFLTSVQDIGRTGYRQSGVAVGGALDPHALRVANLLVGNDQHAAGLEATMGTLRLRFEDDRVVAWCGGAFSVQIADHDFPAGHAGRVGKNHELKLTAPPAGGRAWLSISGGIDVPVVLGSRSTDLRGGFGGHGGRPLRDGDILPLGEIGNLEQSRFEIAKQETPELQDADPRISEWGAPANWTTIAPENAILRIVKAGDWDRFTQAARESFLSASFSVTAESDRMGARFEGPALERAQPGDLLSEAVTAGTVQVPPNGQPILLLGDCQTIGGYPKIAHVITVDLSKAAQLSAGRVVRFREVSLREAQDLLDQREEDFERFRVGLSLHRA